MIFFKGHHGYVISVRINYFIGEKYPVRHLIVADIDDSLPLLVWDEKILAEILSQNLLVRIPVVTGGGNHRAVKLVDSRLTRKNEKRKLSITFHVTLNDNQSMLGQLVELV